MDDRLQIGNGTVSDRGVVAAHGAALPGLYPPNADNMARYEKTKK